MFFDLSLSFRELCANTNVTTQRPAELLAVVESIKKFRIYLQNTFTLIMDHRAIRWLNTSLDPEKENGRLGRWISYLQSYRFTVVHKPGTLGELSMADYLSRAQSGPITAVVNQAKADGMATITSIFNPGVSQGTERRSGNPTGDMGLIDKWRTRG